MATKMIKVRWLRPHKSYAYSTGNLGEVTPAAAATLSEGEDPYIEILPNDFREPVPAPPRIYKDAELIKARMVKFHTGYVMDPGKIGLFTPEDALLLLGLDCIEILPDDFREPVPAPPRIYKDAEMIEAKVIMHHPGFVYKNGEKGMFTPEDFEMLLKGGFVEAIKQESALKTKMLNTLKNILKQK